MRGSGLKSSHRTESELHFLISEGVFLSMLLVKHTNCLVYLPLFLIQYIVSILMQPMLYLAV